MEDVQQEFLIENCAIYVEFLESKTGEITTGAYLLSIAEIKNNVPQIETGAPFIVNSYIVSLIWGQ